MIISMDSLNLTTLSSYIAWPFRFLLRSELRYSSFLYQHRIKFFKNRYSSIVALSRTQHELCVKIKVFNTFCTIFVSLIFVMPDLANLAL